MASEITLFNKDCMIAMREMKDKEFDLAIVDPPYGGGATPPLVESSQSTTICGGGRISG